MSTLFQIQFAIYLKHSIAKRLAGITPNGALAFVSDLCGGYFSDKYISKGCGDNNLLESGDAVMADRGFNITEVYQKMSFDLLSFINGKP